ncbi:MAG: hypothetical protein HN390_10495 [Anaerolineae bacterium]|jgi:hypothetical protein|nr:hypothetical protein [Anaerolineae bacterium]MBT7189637.1 hypothetical protein [Anaerolineae bacterium]MBT7991835.1 hypothetical protein [Anaerolineae bacterium]
MSKSGKTLVFGGILSMLVVLLHIAIIIGGADWYRFFGAGEEMARMAEAGSWLPGIVTFGIAIVFFIWGLYAFSGAEQIKPLPFLRLGLALISGIYLLRGLAIIPALIFAPKLVDTFVFWSSLVSLIIGLAYAIGAKERWAQI